MICGGLFKCHFELTEVGAGHHSFAGDQRGQRGRDAPVQIRAQQVEAEAAAGGCRGRRYELLGRVQCRPGGAQGIHGGTRNAGEHAKPKQGTEKGRERQEESVELRQALGEVDHDSP